MAKRRPPTKTSREGAYAPDAPAVAAGPEGQESGPRPRRSTWAAALAKVAAVSRADGALEHLLDAAGFGHDPALTFVIKRVKKARPPAHELPKRFRFAAYADEDPYVLVPLELMPAIA